MGEVDVPIVELSDAPTPAAPGRGRRLIIGSVALLVVVGAVAVVAASGGRSSDRTTRIDLRALSKTSLEPVRVHIVYDNGEGETVIADGVVDFGHRQWEIVAVSRSKGHMTRTESRVVDGVSYMDPHDMVPSDVMNEPTEAQLDAFLHGRHWLGTGPPHRHTKPTGANASSAQTLGDVTALSYFGGDVAGTLTQLAKAGVHVSDVGPDRVDGVRVEHFRVRYNQSELFSDSTDPPSDFPTTTLDIWVDGTNHELRAETSTPAVHTSTEQSPAYHSTTTFSDYGATVHVVAPKPSDVVPSDVFFRWLTRFEHSPLPNFEGSGASKAARATTTTNG